MRRMSLIHAGLGAWLGLLAGVALAVFVAGGMWPAMVAGGLAIGAAAGMLLGLLAQWATTRHPGGRSMERRYR